jgi:phosphopantetheinyl transferase (holo-ACP synthase)
MSAEGRTIRKLLCATAEVSVDLARENRETLLLRFFSCGEGCALRPRHPASTAGALAAKRALCALVRVLSPEAQVEERDFVLAHDRLGAPFVSEVSPKVPMAARELAISITHTRRRALGLAAIGEPPHAR